MEHSENKKTNPQSSKFGYWLKHSITARMIIVGILVLVLLIPLTYVNLLIEERGFRQNNVVNEINSKWGDEIIIYGPILKVPYKTYSEKSTFNEKTQTYLKETQTHINYAYVFPETLNTEADVNSKKLHLGNFESAVFTTNMALSGHFNTLDLSMKAIEEKDVVWDKATILYKTTNLKGIKNEMGIRLNGNKYDLETNFSDNDNKLSLDELESNYINEELLKSNFNFKIDVTYDGSESIRIIPVSKTTTMQMTSNWADPGFIGNYSPDDETRSITQDGFKVNWKVLSINRAFSQTYFNKFPNLRQFAFGTKFVVLVDEYQKSERSAKYGFLVIGLTFLLFFLIQTMSKINIHPFQYLMIGLALVMFYTLLVSISEHSNFLKAYLIAGISVVTLITVYSKSILKNIKFSMLIGLSLTSLYSFIYVIIQLENYALLVGSIGLFVILALVMLVSRKIDWNNG